MLIIGLCAETADVSAVSTGAQISDVIRFAVLNTAVGVIVLMGRKIGGKEDKDAGVVMGSALWLFLCIGIGLTLLTFFPAPYFAKLLKAPPEAFEKTISYTRISSLGILFMSVYAVFGGVFRALGDSKTPMIIVAVTFVLNFAADIILVGKLGFGAAGSAATNVGAQVLSVVIALIILRKNHLPFHFQRGMIRPERNYDREILRIGLPMAFQDLFVSVSFLVITAIISNMGVIASAGVGVTERIAAFLMLCPSSFSQALSAFTAQNAGAKKPERAQKALMYGILTSFALGIGFFYISYFHGNLLAELFVNDKADVTAAAWSYLRSYAFDCMLTAFLFCFSGFFTGHGHTTFVMWQGIIGAFCVRIPVAYLMSRIPNVSLFKVGLATPCSTLIQIILCLIYMKSRSFRLDIAAKRE